MWCTKAKACPVGINISHEYSSLTVLQGGCANLQLPGRPCSPSATDIVELKGRSRSSLFKCRRVRNCWYHLTSSHLPCCRCCLLLCRSGGGAAAGLGIESPTLSSNFTCFRAAVEVELRQDGWLGAKSCGRVRLPLQEVVAAGKVEGQHRLQFARSGRAQLRLEWHPYV